MSDQPLRAAYANQVQISGSPYDFTIDFACVEDVRNSTANVQPIARIMMQPAAYQSVGANVAEACCCL